MRRRKEKSDVRELKRVYHAYKEYIIRHGAAFNLDPRYPCLLSTNYSSRSILVS